MITLPKQILDKGSGLGSSYFLEWCPRIVIDYELPFPYYLLHQPGIPGDDGTPIKRTNTVSGSRMAKATNESITLPSWVWTKGLVD